MNEFYKLPFNSYKNNKILDELKLKFIKKNNLYEEFINYFKNQWLVYYLNGLLNYKFLTKEQRSNSYIENYNRRIKLRLSKFLYGKNKCKITWPLFLYFIKNEEEDYRNDIYKKEKELKIKYKKIKLFKKVKPIKKLINLNEDKQNNNKKKDNTEKDNFKYWFKWRKNSCRYDCFSLIYALIIFPEIENTIETPDNYNTDYLNKLFTNFTKLDDYDLEKGFWEYLNGY